MSKAKPKDQDQARRESLEAQFQQGEQARKLKGNRYFNRVLSEYREALERNVLALSPMEQDKFSACRSQLMALEAIVKRVDGDIANGDKAQAELSGEMKKVRRVS